jgi:hypothetical protein
MASRFELQAIEMPDGSRKFSLRIRSNVSQKHKGDIIVPQSRVFDALYSSHHFVAHQKVAATHSCCRMTFWNVTQQQCSVFIETCHACVSEKPRTLTMKGSVTPIRSTRYREPHMSPMFSLTFLGISDSHAFPTPTMEKNLSENQFWI